MSKEENTTQIYMDENASIRRVLRESGVGEWSEILESNGVGTIRDLRKVKYTELVQYGITEFEPRRKIFELIKKINTSSAAETGYKRTPLQNRVRDISQMGIHLPVLEREADARESKEGRDAARAQDAGRSAEQRSGEKPLGRVSVLKEGYVSPNSPGSWKKKRDLVEEIMEEAENSIVEETQTDISEESQLQSATDQTGFSDTWQGQEAEGEEQHGEMSSISIGAEKTGRIVVAVRKRPIRKGEEKDVIKIEGSTVNLTERKLKVDLTPYTELHSFAFDRAFSEYSTTQELYRTCIKELVAHALRGGSSTCIAYGQTGSGKTYTMLDERSGIIPQAMQDLLVQGVEVSFCEIYGNQLYDLLEDRKKIFAREKDGVVSIVGIAEKRVRTMDDAMQLVRDGLACRMTGRTGANNNSSRSHALFRVRTAQGICTFVDLAGSERGSERGGEQHILIKREGAEINKSLLALKECIRAMDRSAAHLPFRHSKLTQVLKESLIGDSKCCILATVSPEETSAEHSLNTLRYAFRIKEIGTRGENGVEKEEIREGSRDGSREGGREGGRDGGRDSGRDIIRDGGKDGIRDIVRDNGREIKPQIKEDIRGAVLSSSHETGNRTGQTGTRRTSLENTRKLEVQQALAAVAARIARESDPNALEALKESLINLAHYKNR